MPTTGRPSSAAREMPSAWTAARWMNPERSSAANQCALRESSGRDVVAVLVVVPAHPGISSAWRMQRLSGST